MGCRLRCALLLRRRAAPSVAAVQRCWQHLHRLATAWALCSVTVGHSVHDGKDAVCVHACFLWPVSRLRSACWDPGRRTSSSTHTSGTRLARPTAPFINTMRPAAGRLLFVLGFYKYYSDIACCWANRAHTLRAYRSVHGSAPRAVHALGPTTTALGLSARCRRLPTPGRRCSSARHCRTRTCASAR